MNEIFKQFVVLKPDLLMNTLQVTPDVYERLDAEFDKFAGHTLISAYNFTETWPTWEMHPKGDELVILLSGSVEFKLKMEDGIRSTAMHNAGEFVVVPKGTWHTAIIDEAASMLFITPGEGTLNEPAPPR